MNQILLELRQSKPLETLVEIEPVKEGLKISSNGKLTHRPSPGEIKWEDIIGLSWTFLDPLEDEW